MIIPKKLAAMCFFLLLLDLYRFERPIESITFYFEFKCIVHASSLEQMVYTTFDALCKCFFSCQHFFASVDMSLLLSVSQIMWHSTGINIFYSHYSCNTLFMLVILMLKVVSVSWYITWRFCFISSSRNALFSSTITNFGLPSRSSPWRRSWSRLNLLCQNFLE